MAGKVPCELAVVVEASAGALERVAAAFSTGQIAAVIIRGIGGKLDAGAAKSLVELAQKQAAATLIENDVRLARTLKADGVHLAADKRLIAAYQEAREVLGDRSVVGAWAGKSRHDAMSVAEQGADYVAFGAPAGVKDQQAARLRRLDLIQWWAEIFEVPCVALDVATAVEAVELVYAGADFIAVTLEAGLPAADAEARVAAIQRALQGEH